MKLIDNERLKSIIAECSRLGASVRVRDIAFVLLSRRLVSPETAFQCVFPEGDYKAYVESAELRILTDYMRRTKVIGEDSDENGTEKGLSFDENKRQMEALIQRTEEGLADGTIDPAVGLKIIADIRVKLNDKFNVVAQEKERTIVVNAKYNSVCDHCGHETYVPTKEQLMEKYNLTERK